MTAQNSCSLVHFYQSCHPILTQYRIPLTTVQGLYCYLPEDASASPYCPSSLQGTFFSAVGRMPCTKGAINYKNIISEILPNGEYGWQAVSVSFPYHEQPKEEQPSNTDNMKRH